MGDGKPPKRQVVAEPELVLQVGEPGRVDVQHQVGPGLIVDGIAGVYIARIHQHHGAGTDLEVRLLVDIGTAPGRDRPDGKMY
ncbi:hypothetical protein D3C84_860830 [compost metagenome]